ncbi:MAG TPA: hypothetical protein VFM54_19090 [Micromonosporaceae bacterium]|nr:hypothetical protein [Micromonosporaceae bacterium]
MTLLIEAVALAAAATAAAWPAGTGRVRRSRLGLGAAARPPLPVGAWRAMGDLRAATPAAAAVVVAAATLPAMLAAGPVAGGVVAVYTGLGARALLRRRQARVQAGIRAQALDDLADIAAELRAGRPAPAGPPARLGTGAAGGAVGGGAAAGGTLRARSAAAVALAEETGAPLADLLEQIEADARAADRAATAATAQTAGARTTAVLLAGLPAAGVALGYGIGADPLHVLLRTPLGAGCAAVAIALQLAGLAWMSRITAPGGGA